MDKCNFCQDTVYPDDEKVEHDCYVYHIECAEESELEEAEE